MAARIGTTRTTIQRSCPGRADVRLIISFVQACTFREFILPQLRSFVGKFFRSGFICPTMWDPVMTRPRGGVCLDGPARINTKPRRPDWSSPRVRRVPRIRYVTYILEIIAVCPRDRRRTVSSGHYKWRIGLGRVLQYRGLALAGHGRLIMFFPSGASPRFRRELRASVGSFVPPRFRRELRASVGSFVPPRSRRELRASVGSFVPPRSCRELRASVGSFFTFPSGASCILAKYLPRTLREGDQQSTLREGD